MQNLFDYIIEKLYIDKNINSKVSTEEMYEQCWFGDADNYMDMKSNFFERRKSPKKVDGKEKNRPWYAVFIYLQKYGPAKRSKIKEILWPGKTGQQAELFTNVKYCNIVTGIGDLSANNDYSSWKWLVDMI